MALFLWFLYLTGAVPLWQAWLSNRDRPLSLAVVWGILAWACWGGVIGLSAFMPHGTDLDSPRYLALSVTGCAGVAVLGCRRPGVGAWNFVVVSLLAVMLWPLIQRWLLNPGSLAPDWMWQILVIAPLIFLVLNYLPTSMRTAALMLALGCGVEIGYLWRSQPDWREPSAGWVVLALVPWTGLVGWLRQPKPKSEFDQVWLDFRNRYGFVWAQRSREQFNRSAENNKWPVTLTWNGLQTKPGEERPDDLQLIYCLKTLRGLLKRFLPGNQESQETPEEPEQ